jgi:hypothetical protein
MADENVAATTGTETAAAPAAAEAPKAAERIAPPGKGESLVEKMERLGWERDGDPLDNPDSLAHKANAGERDKKKPPAKAEEAKAEDAEIDEEEPEKHKAAEQAADPLAPKREQLKALIAELGMQLEDGRVTSVERAALRGERRDAKEALAKLEREAQARIEAATKALEEREASHKPRFDKLGDFEKAIEVGDHDKIAQVAGFESWDKLQEHVIALKADPAYQRMRALEKQVEEREKQARERDEKAKREAEEQETRARAEASQRERAEAQAAYRKQLSSEMAQSTDPLLRAMADDPSFVGAIFRVQDSHYDGGNGRLLTPEEALRTPPKGSSSSPLMAELKKLHDRLAPIFGQPVSNEAAAAAAVKAGAVGKQPPAAEKPKRTPPRTPSPPAPPAASKTKDTDRDWKINAQRRLEEAAREERLARKAG